MKEKILKGDITMLVGIVKTVTGLAVSAGVTSTLGMVAKKVLPVGLSKSQKILTSIGVMSMTAMVAEKTSTYVEEQMQPILAILVVEKPKEEEEQIEAE